MGITMNELAKKLGVSIATVSRVLSGSEDSVSEEVRKSILEGAEQYGYRRRRRIGRTVAFIIDKELFNLSSLFYTSVISGIEKEVTSRRYYFQFSAVDPTAGDQVNLKFSDLAGTILVGTFDSELAHRLRSMHVPMVLVDYSIPTEDIDTILIDNVDGIMRAGKHLAELGHRRVAYISGMVDSASSQERRYGFARASETYGFEEDPKLIEVCPESISGGFDAMKRLLDRGGPRPTAVIAYNDMVAIGAMDAAKHRGIVIPREISIIGFDDISLAAEVAPPLTTVQVPKELMGRMTAETLFQHIAGKQHQVRKILLPTHVVVRGTTAPPTAARPSR